MSPNSPALTDIGNQFTTLAPRPLLAALRVSTFLVSRRRFRFEFGKIKR